MQSGQYVDVIALYTKWFKMWMEHLCYINNTRVFHACVAINMFVMLYQEIAKLRVKCISNSRLEREKSRWFIKYQSIKK